MNNPCIRYQISQIFDTYFCTVFLFQVLCYLLFYIYNATLFVKYFIFTVFFFTSKNSRRFFNSLSFNFFFMSIIAPEILIKLLQLEKCLHFQKCQNIGFILTFVRPRPGGSQFRIYDLQNGRNTLTCGLEGQNVVKCQNNTFGNNFPMNFMCLLWKYSSQPYTC